MEKYLRFGTAFRVTLSGSELRFELLCQARNCVPSYVAGLGTAFRVTLVVVAVCFQGLGQIRHVEPLNWWVGMKNPNVELLVNGSEVGGTTPVIRYPGVSIAKVSRGDSPNYLFIDLVIGGDALPGSFDILFQKEGRVVYTYPYSLLARESDPALLKGFNSSDVIYLIVPDRFANGDYGNDVVSGMKEGRVNRGFDGGRHGGDIRGMIDHLDYIRDMGFTAIWSTPLLENDMNEYSYHGYSITNHYKVDPRFGTLADYKELAVKARQRGLKLIFDEVLNHIGANYWWMGDMPFKDWLNYQGGFQPTNHRRTVNQDSYAAQYDKDLMTHGWFVRSMPDMNGENPFMAKYLIQATIWWIETLQLGGIRQDTYSYSDKTFLQHWSCGILEEYPNFSMVGEEWSLNPLITSYWQRGKQNRDGYVSCLPCVMDFPLQSALVEALNEPHPKEFGKGFAVLYEALANDFVYADPNNILVMGDNHDMDRLYTQLNNDVDLTKMAVAYLLTIRGIPQFMYGTELLMENTGKHKVDGLIRSDFPGGWKGDSIDGFSGKGLSAAQSGMQAYMKKLLNWRSGCSAIQTGKTLHFAPFDGAYVYFRYDADRMVMVVMNKNASEVTVDTKRFKEILGGKSIGTDVLSGVVVDLQKPIVVSAKTALVMEIK